MEKYQFDENKLEQINFTSLHLEKFASSKIGNNTIVYISNNKKNIQSSNLNFVKKFPILRLFEIEDLS